MLVGSKKKIFCIHNRGLTDPFEIPASDDIIPRYISYNTYVYVYLYIYDVCDRYVCVYIYIHTRIIICVHVCVTDMYIHVHITFFPQYLDQFFVPRFLSRLQSTLPPGFSSGSRRRAPKPRRRRWRRGRGFQTWWGLTRDKKGRSYSRWITVISLLHNCSIMMYNNRIQNMGNLLYDCSIMILYNLENLLHTMTLV